MILESEAGRRVLQWRVRDLGVRALEAVTLGAVVWSVTSNTVVFVWLAATLAASTLDAQLCRHALMTPATRRLTFAVGAALGLSATVFASVAFVMLANPNPYLLAGAVVVLCSGLLRNAAMTRGCAAAFLPLALPASTMLMASPFLAELRTLGQSEIDALLLTIGTAVFCVFVWQIASYLHAEAHGLRTQLKEQSRQRELAARSGEEADHARRRWHMAFRQSPLPQLCYEATRLYEVIRPEFEAGERRLGDLVRTRLATTSEALGYFRVIEANQATATILGLAARNTEVTAEHFDERLLGDLCDALNQIGPDGVLPPFESKLLRGDGETVDVQMHVRMPLGQDPPWSLCVASYIDITAIKRAARAERDAREAAEAANRAKSDFLAVMSHEIRTPLNGVLGMAQAMERERLPDEQLERLRVIQRSGAALRDILDDILDLSKIEAGKLELERADFDAADLAGQVHGAFVAAARRKGLAFDLLVDPRARGCFWGDAARLRQVLCNLVSNAIKFTETGHVRLEMAPIEAGLRFVVSDTGIGVAAERLPQLFEKFVQADSSTTRRFGGTGLGLAICKELCAAMGGEIAAVSDCGAGSTFVIDLPLERVQAQPEPPPMAAPPAPSPGAAVRILAAEDNSVNQLVLRTLLEQVGIEPVIVANGAEALSAWRGADWDLILMDIQMPVMDGPKAAQAIRREETENGRRRTPIIALTANAMTHQIAGYRAMGMDDVVAKPIDVADLFRAISELQPAD